MTSEFPRRPGHAAQNPPTLIESPTMTRMLTLVALALACVFAISPALAAEVVAPVPVAPAVILPWGDWIVAIGQTLTSVLLPVLFALLGKAVYQIAP